MLSALLDQLADDQRAAAAPGVTRKRSMTPRSMSSMSAMPLQPADESAVITTTPGAR